MDVNTFEYIVETLDCAINSTKRRHIVGGILLSVSLLFGGLAFTVMTTKIEEKDYEQFYD